MSTFRKISGLASLTAFGVTAIAATQSHAATIAYYQFEDSPGFLQDSSPNNLDLTNSGASQVVNPGFGALAGAESASLPGSSGSQGLSVADPLSNTDFTVEAFFRLDAFNTSDNFFVTQYNTSGSDRGFRIETNGSALSLRLGYSGGSNEEEVFSFAPSTNTNYYFAIAVDLGAAAGSTTATLYSQDLTNGGLLITETETFSSVTSGNFNNSTANLIIGNSANNSNTNALFEGIIDEVRISNVALAENQLLISVIPEPASLSLLAIGSCLLAGRRRHS